jgi:hypothetical protein
MLRSTGCLRHWMFLETNSEWTVTCMHVDGLSVSVVEVSACCVPPVV